MSSVATAWEVSRRREVLMRAAQALRCPSCGSEQIQLRAFDAITALWRCRMCRPAREWETTGQ